MNPLTNSIVCDINIEKSSVAKGLEKQLGIEWGFDQYSPLDNFFHLRACITESVSIPQNKTIPIPTGIYPQLLHPGFEIEVKSFSDLVYEQGLCLADGVSTFGYTFRNEVWLLIKNNFEEAQTIHPAQKIATFSVIQRPQMVINYVDWIEESSWKMPSAKSYIQKIKNKLRKSSNKKERQSVGYSRAEIEKYIEDNNGS